MTEYWTAVVMILISYPNAGGGSNFACNYQVNVKIVIEKGSRRRVVSGAEDISSSRDIQMQNASIKVQLG